MSFEVAMYATGVFGIVVGVGLRAIASRVPLRLSRGTFCVGLLHPFDGLLEVDQYGYVQLLNSTSIRGMDVLVRIAGEVAIPDGCAGG